MSKAGSGGKGTSGNKGGATGGGRPATGFPGGNWPSTKSGVISGGNRGNAPAKGK